jgi:DNA-nicking Smr family endonuclease
MTPEDIELWKQVTEGLVPLVLTPTATMAAVRSLACHTSFSRTLDLHGMTLNEAHAQTKKAVYEANVFYGLKYITIITGLSGQIRREFPFWIEALPEVKKLEVLNGGGAFKVFLKKKNQRPK